METTLLWSLGSPASAAASKLTHTVRSPAEQEPGNECRRDLHGPYGSMDLTSPGQTRTAAETQGGCGRLGYTKRQWELLVLGIQSGVEPNIQEQRRRVPAEDQCKRPRFQHEFALSWRLRQLPESNSILPSGTPPSHRQAVQPWPKDGVPGFLQEISWSTTQERDERTGSQK
ncbi:hypothetical protein B0T16DRAFT_385307 [Cercophora newfieldiana]|uniref:Uncharacterized protein n=1 Tax=Cercophora newfieldiana TaxID=92897 RepID=A0AA39YQ39_9PEZI|nr:hypothetical protein B0T16DRAFT_385307 [Cercophora newfieldiana]